MSVAAISHVFRRAGRPVRGLLSEGAAKVPSVPSSFDPVHRSGGAVRCSVAVARERCAGCRAARAPRSLLIARFLLWFPRARLHPENARLRRTGCRISSGGPAVFAETLGRKHGPRDTVGTGANRHGR